MRSIHPDVVAVICGGVAGYLTGGDVMEAKTRFPTSDRMVRQSLLWVGLPAELSRRVPLIPPDPQLGQVPRSLRGLTPTSFQAGALRRVRAQSCCDWITQLRRCILCV